MHRSVPTRLPLALVLAAFLFAGCASTDAPQGETGALSLDLVLEGGIEIDEVAWTISGNGMEMSGTIDVSAPGSTASVEVFGLPPGDGYLVELSATSVDGEVMCGGSAPFAVEIGISTPVMVILNCKLPQRFGGVRVNGEFNICAELTKMVVSPLQTSVGNDISLFSAAQDEEGDPITTMWMSSSGTIADPMAAATTYTCTEVGDDDITVLVSDDGGTYCMSMWTVPVTCVAGEGDPCEGVICESDGNECTAEACNPQSGLCESSNVENGTPCLDNTGTCTDGECVTTNLCEGVTCESDGNECTTEACNPQSGLCESSNVENGTPCLDNTGTCTDGTCVTTDLCEGVTCEDDGNECTTETCNPANGQCQSSNVANGTDCGDGGACLDGTCVQGDPCEGVVCDPTGNECTVGICNSQTGLCDETNVPNGTSCNGGAGECSNGECVAGSIDYPEQTANLTVGCRNNVTTDISILPFDLSVDPGPMSASAAFTAGLDGLAAFSEAFLDAAQAVVPGGVRSGQLIVSNGGGLAATVAATGAVTGANVQLGPDPASLQSRCALTGVPCTGAPGLGNCLSIPVVNNNCTTGFVDIPVQEGTPLSAGGCTPATPGVPPPDCNCAPCAALDVAPSTTKAAECAANGFCVTGDLPLPLNAANGNYTAGATSGQPMYFDWIQPYGLDGDGTITLPAAVFAQNPAPVGVRVSAGGLFVALQCAGGVDSGGPDGVGVPDDASPTPNANKIQFLVP
jgi:hypothetical protein